MTTYTFNTNQFMNLGTSLLGQMCNFNSSCNFTGGMNMFGMSGLGMGSFGGFGSSSIFTNCFGETNFDAMAGWGVAQAVVGTITQAVSANMANKAKTPEVDYNKEIEDCDAKIKELKKKDPEKEIDAKYDNNIKTAKTSSKKLRDSLTEDRKQLNELNKQQAENKDDNTIKTQIDQLDEKIKQEEPEYNKLVNGSATDEGSIEWHKQQKKDAIAAKKKEIEEEIKELENKKAELQRKLDDQVLDKADNGRKTSDKKYEAYLDTDGNLKEGSYTKKDFKTAISRFMNAVEDDDKKTKAKQLLSMYKQLPESEKTNQFKESAGIAKAYIENHSNED